MEEKSYIDLATLQDCISEQVEGIQAWVKAEVDSCKCSGGHYYLGLIQKSKNGTELAKARGIIWRSHASLLTYFRKESGKDLGEGMEVLIYVAVNYDARFGLSLIIKDIDAGFTVGQREQQRLEAIRKLQDEGYMQMQKELALPYLPGRIAVISSEGAAGYGDFVNQLSSNAYGFRFDLTLFDSVMQGDKCPASISASLDEICNAREPFDMVVIMRGGGAESDMFCYDDYELCRNIAACSIPVITAIGHDRDFHIADMVAAHYVKTPTALAAYLVDWVAEIEAGWQGIVDRIRLSLASRIGALDQETLRCVSNIRFALNASLDRMDNTLALMESRIAQADPRSILRQGYVLACDKKGNIYKSAGAAAKGSEFTLRFKDGRWECKVKDTKIEKQQP